MKPTRNIVKNLNLSTVRFPITALLSISHRASGVCLFLALPIFIWFLYSINSSASDYTFIKKTIFSNIGYQIIAIGLAFCLVLHLLAGIRHLIMDFLSIGENMTTAKKTALLTFIIAIVITVLIIIQFII